MSSFAALQESHPRLTVLDVVSHSHFPPNAPVSSSAARCCGRLQASRCCFKLIACPRALPVCLSPRARAQSSNALTSLAGFDKLPALRVLSVRGNKIDSLAGVEALAKLEKLNIG